MEIEDQDIELNGVVYHWLYDSVDPNPTTCYRWVDHANVEPANLIRDNLNQLILKRILPQAAVCGDEQVILRVARIALGMGMPLEEVKYAFGYESLAKEEEAGRRSRPLLPNNPFCNNVLIKWVLHAGILDPSIPTTPTTLGSGPFEEADFDSILRQINIEPSQVDESCDVLVVGHDGWDKAVIDQIIDQRSGRVLRVYSQEMFLTFLITGVDPFYGGPEILQQFRVGHPALEYLCEGWSGWVTTWVGRSKSQPQVLSDWGWNKESPLIVMGYRVGRNGESASVRKAILRKAFEGPLPVVGDRAYLQHWGEAGKPDRLRKIAEHIAFLCKNSKLRINKPEEAIEDWQSDLDWLKGEYYRGHFKFRWPSTTV